MRKRNTTFHTGDLTSKSTKGEFGLEEEMSLQSVQFATTLNTYLNEQQQREEFEND